MTVADLAIGNNAVVRILNPVMHTRVEFVPNKFLRFLIP